MKKMLLFQNGFTYKVTRIAQGSFYKMHINRNKVLSEIEAFADTELKSKIMRKSYSIF